MFSSTTVLMPNVFCRLDVGQLTGDQSEAGINACCDVNAETPVGLLEGNLDLHNYGLIPHPVTVKRSLSTWRLHDFLPPGAQLCNDHSLLYAALTWVTMAFLNG